VNLIAGKPLVTELIQGNFTALNLIAELKRILFDKKFIEAQQAGYALIQQMLGDTNTAEKAAELMIGYLKEEVEVAARQV
jgi:lipid-A-disaccharide synthase